MITTWDTLDEARAALRDVVAGAPGTGWELATPCTQWNATQVLQHAALDQLAWAAAVGGTAMPTDNPFAPTGSLASSPLTCVDESLAASAEAWTRISGSPSVATPLPQGELAPSVAAAAAALDAVIHAWDIAVATGQGSPLSPALARALRPVAESIVEPLRQYGAYAAVVEVPAGASDDAALLAYLGRRPDWAA
jgi:uncharacterized protein (TIGR03086 family)